MLRKSVESLHADNGHRSAVREAALQIMVPLAALLLSAKMGIGEFTALAKLALVRAAANQARASGDHEPRRSELAVATGISRNDIPELLNARAARPLAFRRGRAIADRVLSGWWNDPEFKDHLGRPAALHMSSVVTLVKRYSIGTKRAAPVVKELLRAQAVEQLQDGRLKPLKPTCVNAQWDRESLASLGLEVRRHLDALLNNLNSPGAVTFTRSVESDALAPHPTGILVKELKESAEILIDGARERFSHHRGSRLLGTARPTKIVLAIQILEEPAGVGSEQPRPRGLKKRTRRSAGKGTRRRAGWE